MIVNSTNRIRDKCLWLGILNLKGGGENSDELRELLLTKYFLTTSSKSLNSFFLSIQCPPTNRWFQTDPQSIARTYISNFPNTSSHSQSSPDFFLPEVKIESIPIELFENPNSYLNDTITSYESSHAFNHNISNSVLPFWCASPTFIVFCEQNITAPFLVFF